MNAAQDVRAVLSGQELKEFGEAVDRRVEIKVLMEDLKSELDSLNNWLIISLCNHNAEAGVLHGKHRVMIVTRENKRLDKERLLENGVPASVIAASTVTTMTSFLDIKELKSP